jgi:hypothetical protein
MEIHSYNAASVEIPYVNIKLPTMADNKFRPANF